MKLAIATCQFPVSANISANQMLIFNLMSSAKAQGANVAHFPEASLSGYAGVDFASFDKFDWDALRTATRGIMSLARELRLWVVLGSAHELSGTKPHNCSYIIDADGQIVDRYDKMFCAGDSGETSGDLLHYAAGSHFSVFTLNGVRCGVLICHDYRYPELYREYKRRGVQVIFHAFHAGGIGGERYAGMEHYVGPENRYFGTGSTLPAITMPAGMIASASNNYMWISCPNSSAAMSCWPSFFVRPDGVITGALPPDKTGVLISTADTTAEYYDSTAAWRERAMNGRYHSGRLIEDACSRSRTEL